MGVLPLIIPVRKTNTVLRSLRATFQPQAMAGCLTAQGTTIGQFGWRYALNHLFQ